MDPFLIIILLTSGAFAGFLAGLFGVGGGIILVPALYYTQILWLDETNLHAINNQAMHVSIGTSLAIIIPTGLSSAWAHFKNNAVRFDILSVFAPGIVTGSALGVIAAGSLSGTYLKFIFSFLIILLAIHMALAPQTKKTSNHLPRNIITIPVTFLIGMLSSLIGIGGATFSVPFMRIFGTAMKQAIGTASVIGLLISIPGAFGFATLGLVINNNALSPHDSYTIGFIHWLAWLIIVPVSICCAPLGAKYAHLTNPHLLKRLFSALMCIIAVKMLIETLSFL